MHSTIARARCPGSRVLQYFTELEKRLLVRKAIVVWMAAMLVLFGGLASATSAQAGSTTVQSKAGAVAAAPKPITVKATFRASINSLGKPKTAVKLFDTYVELKSSQTLLVLGFREGPSSAKKLWKAKKGQRVNVKSVKGKTQKLRVLRVIKNEDFETYVPSRAEKKKIKAIVALGTLTDLDKTRTFILGK